MSDTPNLSLPYIEGGQSQKEVTHNQALNALDILTQPNVISFLSVPPSSPINGQAWIVGAAPSGAWAAKEAQIAAWFDGWLFLIPKAGWTVFDQDSGRSYIFSGVSWIDALQRPAPSAEVPALDNAWIGLGGEYVNPRYFKTADNRVMIEGAMQSGTDGTIFTLLEGYRPAARMIFTCYSAGGPYRVDVLANGEVVVAASNAFFSSLSGISFFAV